MKPVVNIHEAAISAAGKGGRKAPPGVIGRTGDSLDDREGAL